MTKVDLFLKLAQPDEKGYSRWVNVNEFVGEYSLLRFGNGGSWCRKSSTLAKKYKIETNRKITKGNSIDAIRLVGLNTQKVFNQSIRKDIKDYYKKQNCVVLGVNGISENTTIEIDHKDGRKNNERISDVQKQRLEDFQPLSKAANDVKRQICKQCKQTDKRWDAKNIKGNPYSYYEGDEHYTEELGCKGCYQYDPVEYRKTCAKKICSEACTKTADFIMKQLYGEDFL